MFSVVEKVTHKVILKANDMKKVFINLTLSKLNEYDRHYKWSLKIGNA
jgi:hypothetical protein